MVKHSNYSIWALIAIAGASAFAAPSARAYELGQWTQAQSARSAQTLFRNIGPSTAVPGAARGAVVASPSRDPDYRYHWVRDGALVMGTVLGFYERAVKSAEKTALLGTLLEFVDFSRRNQLTPNPSGPADGLGLGEPKFMVDGGAFEGSWGRPQNDGPALRATTLIRLAHLLLDQGREKLVREKLYDPSVPARTVIKADLEFVSRHWGDSSFDLWEEVRGDHFYTRLVQRRALMEGAALADRMGDGGAARWYRSQARAIEPTIERHWDANRGFVVATLDRDGGLEGKASDLDVAVILGALHASSPGKDDRYFHVTDDRVLATAEKISEAFRKLYAINGRERDGDNQPLGVGIGRYPEDHYSGVAHQNSGNPWFLATFAFAELYYACANEWEADGRIRVTPANLPLLRRLKARQRLRMDFEPKELIRAGDPRFQAMIEGLRALGDDYLRRGRFHGDPGGAFSEQFNRDSGYMQSAEELTWSHSSLITAVWARDLRSRGR